MTINQNKEGNKLILSVEGRLDTLTAPELEATLATALEGVEELVLDLANLEYVSSAGLRVILKARKVMYTQGKMKLIHVNESVMDVFEFTGFDNILHIEKE